MRTSVTTLIVRILFGSRHNKKHNKMNNMFELANKYPELNITVRVGELLEMAEYLVKLTRKELEQQITDVNTETYPSPDQVAKILNIDKSTLWRWGKRGYLKPIEVGGKRRYRMSDIKGILEEGKNGNN